MDPNIQQRLAQNIPPPISPQLPTSRGWIKWVVFIIIAIILSSTGTYFLAQSQSQKSSEPIVQAPATPTPTPDPTANWKTYTNTKYGYSLKYPSSFFIYEFSEPIHEPNGTIDTTEIINYETSDVSSGNIDPDNTNVFVMLIKYPSGKIADLSTVRENYKDTQYMHYNIIDYSVGSQPALKIELTSQIGGMTRVEVITVYKSKIFSFELRSANSKYASYLDQILSTFKFTDSTDETTDWKIYTDPNGSFSFRYPPKVNKGEVHLGIPQGVVSGGLSVITKSTNFSPANVLTKIYIDHPYSLTDPDGEPGPFTLTINVWINKENITNDQIKTALLSYKPSPGPYQATLRDIKDYQNGEIEGVYFEVTVDQSHQEIFMATKDKLYRFLLSSESSGVSGKGREFIDQILSTFTLLNNK